MHYWRVKDQESLTRRMDVLEMIRFCETENEIDTDNIFFLINKDSWLFLIEAEDDPL